MGKPVGRRGCCHLGCRLWPEILEGSDHMVWLQTDESTMWRQLRRDLGLWCHSSKDTPPQLLTVSGLTTRYRGGVVGAEEGDKGPEAENSPVRECMCGGSSHVLFWLFWQLWASERRFEHSGVFILNMVLHHLAELHGFMFCMKQSSN